MLNEELVRKELLRLRNERFRSKAEFLAVSGLYGQLVRQVERGSLPRLAAMARWTEACGVTLDAFIKHCLELQAGIRNKKLIAEHPLVPAARFVADADPQIADAMLLMLQRFLSRLPASHK